MDRIPHQYDRSAPDASPEDVAAATSSQAGTTQPTQPTQPATTAGPAQNRGKGNQHTRVSAWWVGMILAAIILIAMLIFIGQNSQQITVRYLGADGHISLAIALLLSAVAGVLLVAIPGTARIIQLRHALKKTAHARGAGAGGTASDRSDRSH